MDTNTPNRSSEIIWKDKDVHIEQMGLSLLYEYSRLWWQNQIFMQFAIPDQIWDAALQGKRDKT